MRKLVLDSKTGFVAYCPFRIFDERGVEFYNSEFVNKIKNGKPQYFNIPKGVYSYEGDIYKQDLPINYNDIKLPPKQRDYPPKKYKITFGDNPHKCTISHKKGIIFFDKAFKKAPKYVLYDIYFHELGHQFYKTEEFADRYATKRLLEIGFNPSQIGKSSVISLRNSVSHYRKKAKVESLNKNKRIL